MSYLFYRAPKNLYSFKSGQDLNAKKNLDAELEPVQVSECTDKFMDEVFKKMRAGEDFESFYKENIGEVDKINRGTSWGIFKKP